MNDVIKIEGLEMRFRGCEALRASPGEGQVRVGACADGEIGGVLKRG